MSAVARRLLAMIDRFLEAPVPAWVRYNPDQISNFGTPERVEQYFATRYGEEIEEDYLLRFQCQLNQLFQLEEGSQQVFSCSVVEFKISRDMRDMCLWLIRVRPCASGLKILKVVLYCMAKCCVRCSSSLSVSVPLSQTAPELEKISNKFDRRMAVWILPFEDIEDAEFQLDDKIIINFPADGTPEVVLNPDKWPLASALNAQGEVDARFAVDESRRAHVSREPKDLVPFFKLVRFTLQIHSSSAMKPGWEVIAYLDEETESVFVDFDGKKYQSISNDGPEYADLFKKKWKCERVVVNDPSEADAREKLKFSLCGGGVDGCFVVRIIEQGHFPFEDERKSGTYLSDTMFPDLSLTMKGEDACLLEDVDRKGYPCLHTRVDFKSTGILIVKLHRISDQLETKIKMDVNDRRVIRFEVTSDDSENESHTKRFRIEKNLDCYQYDIGLSEWILHSKLTTARRLKAWVLYLLQPVAPSSKPIIFDIFQACFPLDSKLKASGSQIIEAATGSLDDRIELVHYNSSDINCLYNGTVCKISLYVNNLRREIFIHGPHFKFMCKGLQRWPGLKFTTSLWDIKEDGAIQVFFDGSRNGFSLETTKLEAFPFEKPGSCEQYSPDIMPYEILLTLNQEQYWLKHVGRVGMYLQYPVRFESIVAFIHMYPERMPVLAVSAGDGDREHAVVGQNVLEIHTASGKYKICNDLSYSTMDENNNWILNGKFLSREFCCLWMREHIPGLENIFYAAQQSMGHLTESIEFIQR